MSTTTLRAYIDNRVAGTLFERFTGEPAPEGHDFTGPEVHRATFVCGLWHGIPMPAAAVTDYITAERAAERDYEENET